MNDAIDVDSGVLSLGSGVGVRVVGSAHAARIYSTASHN